MKQPFENIGSIITAEELIDLAFSTASKVTIPRIRRSIVWVRRKERQRIKIVEATITSRLNKTFKKMPRMEEIHPFYIDLADVLVGVKNFKKSLAALNWAVKRIQSFSSTYSRRAGRARTISEASRIRREAYGRIASVLKQVSRDLTFLKEAGEKLAKLPSVDPNLITIAIAGYANVGKSTLVKQLSTAKPEIATYPFTTKGIVVGHRDTPSGRCQVIDTPGLLDRPLSERNKEAGTKLNRIMLSFSDSGSSFFYSQLNEFRVGVNPDFHGRSMIRSQKKRAWRKEEQKKARMSRHRK